MSFDLLETLQRVLRNELSRSQILDESKRLRLLQRDSQDFSTVKYVLQIGLLEEIMKSENLTNREYYASLLQSSLERLNLKSRREQGYRCFLGGCFSPEGDIVNTSIILLKLILIERNLHAILRWSASAFLGLLMTLKTM